MTTGHSVLGRVSSFLRGLRKDDGAVAVQFALLIVPMTECATDAQHVYLPSTGTALKDAFRAIGQDISRLRISH